MFKKDIQNKIINNLITIVQSHRYFIVEKTTNMLPYTVYAVCDNNNKEIFRISKSLISPKLYLYINAELLNNEFDQNLLSGLYNCVCDEYKNPKSNIKTKKQPEKIEKGSVKHQKILLNFIQQYARYTK